MTNLLNADADRVLQLCARLLMPQPERARVVLTIGATAQWCRVQARMSDQGGERLFLRESGVRSGLDGSCPKYGALRRKLGEIQWVSIGSIMIIAVVSDPIR